MPVKVHGVKESMELVKVNIVDYDLDRNLGRFFCN